MAEGRKFALSIVLRSVDHATAGLRRVNARLSAMTAPIRRARSSFVALGREAGLPQLARGLGGVGVAARGVAKAIGGIAIATGLGVAGIRSMISSGDQLAKQADRLGLTVDAYSQLRFAASQSGTEMGRFDSAMEGFSKRLGEARAGMGSLHTFLGKVSPALLRQIKGAKDNGEAFEIMAAAMGRIEDPAKRAALASAAFGRSGVVLLNLFAAGPDGIRKLREEYSEIAGSQEDAARKSELLTDAMGRIDAAVSGVKAQLLVGLAPALLELAEGLKRFLVDNRGRVAEWARDFGERLPARIADLGRSLSRLIDSVRPVWDAIGGLKGAAVLLAAAIAGPLISSLYALGVAMLTTPFGLFVTGVAGLVVAGKELAQNWHLVRDFFGELWEDIKGIFARAWEYIGGIVDRIAGAVRTVRDAAGAVADYFGGGSGGPGNLAAGRAAFRAAPARSAAPQSAKVTIDISGAPRGSRARVARDSDADVDLSVGYALGGV